MYFYQTISLLLLGLCPLSVSAQFDQQRCQKINERREIRDLSDLERNKFFFAVQTLMSRPLSNYTVNYHKLVQLHWNNHEITHGVPVFLPWHRYFLRLFEQDLQTIDPSVALPYWNWSKDSQSPEASLIFTSRYFGGNGNRFDKCLRNGRFAYHIAQVPYEHCLMRDFAGGDIIPSFYPPEALEVIIETSNTFRVFAERIEGPPHASVHDNVGGDQGDMTVMFSPNDPIFWMHHAFLDQLWHEWQLRKGSYVGNTYDAPRTNLGDPIPEFEVPVRDLLDTTGPLLCYKYPRFSVELPKVKGKFNSTKRPASMRSKTFIEKVTKLKIETKKWESEKITAKGFDELIEKILNGEVVTVSVSPTDRTTQHKLRSPPKLSDRVMRNFHIDPEKARMEEEIMRLYTDALNAIDDYESPAILESKKFS